MTSESEFSKKRTRLRTRAETRLAAMAWDNDPEMNPRTRRLLHELHVHQIELEMQNEELREAQRDLEMSRDRYLELFHHAPVGYVVTDADAMVLQANQTFAHMLDESLTDLLHQPISGLIHPEDRDLFFARFKAFYNTPEGKHLELRLVKRDRSVFFTSMAGRRIGGRESSASPDDRRDRLFITISDITRQKENERAVMRAKTQWEQTFDAVPDLIAIIDHKSTIVRVNRSLADRLGLEPSACVGKKCFEILHENREPPPNCPHRTFLKTGRSSRKEHFNRKLNGHFIFTVSSFNAGGQAADWCVHVAHDITDRKRAETERLKLRNLESIGTLAGGIAHDFNNILTAIVGNIEMIEISLAQFEKRRFFADTALKNCFKARDLANRLLTFSTGGFPKRQPIPIGRLLEETAQLTLSGTSVSYQLHLPDRLAPVAVDEIQIKSALQNVISNAMEAMPRGGVVHITARPVDGQPGESATLTPGRHLRIDIHDQGSGIRPEHLDKIFDPYFTTKPMGAQKGMGLGLAISHSVIKKHAGRIGVRSHMGKGTTVTIHLPCAAWIEAPV